MTRNMFSRAMHLRYCSLGFIGKLLLVLSLTFIIINILILQLSQQQTRSYLERDSELDIIDDYQDKLRRIQDDNKPTEPKQERKDKFIDGVRPVVNKLNKPMIYTSTNSFNNVPSKYIPTGITETDDRLIQQLEATSYSHKPSRNKIILQYYPLGFDNGDKYFKKHCLVKTCVMSEDQSLMLNDSVQVDGVIFETDAEFSQLPPKKQNQVWMVFTLESPEHTSGTQVFKDKINWTITYRTDSTIVAPYFKYVPFTQQRDSIRGEKLPTKVNYAKVKTKLIAWFVTNCGSKSGRLDYVKELKKYIHVDIYGSCGHLRCDRFSRNQECEDMLEKDYKFYLAFENSICKDYITEKPHVHGLVRNVVPVVLGASVAEYKRILPPHSFIHVDEYESPSALADYINKLDKDDKMYNEYFKWKEQGSMIDTHLLCRICAMLHQPLPPIWYEDLHDWWTNRTCKVPDKYNDANIKGRLT